MLEGPLTEQDRSILALAFCRRRMDMSSENLVMAKSAGDALGRAIRLAGLGAVVLFFASQPTRRVIRAASSER